MNYWRHQWKSEQEGSQKEPLAESVKSRFGKVINVGAHVVTFTQSGRATRVNEGTFKGVMRERKFRRDSDDHPWTEVRCYTYYIVERPDGKRTKLHYEQSLCHADISVRDLIGHNI